MGLISIAVAMPVTLFLQAAFELSNEVEMPDFWLTWQGGLEMLLIGRDANKDWHYTRDGPMPNRFRRWYARYYLQREPTVITLANLWDRFSWWLRGKPPSWEQEWAEECEKRDKGSAAASGSGSSGGETAEAMEEAAAETRSRRLLSAAGVLGALLTWAIFAWFIFTYGLLIYNTLGASAQADFTNSWGISYAMDQVTQWQDILEEVVKAVIILAILERLLLTRHSSWLEEHIDFLSLQAHMFGSHVYTFRQQVAMFVHNQRRLSDE